MVKRKAKPFKIFDGKRYTKRGGCFTKKYAEDVKKGLKRHGKLVRIVPAPVSSRFEYIIYTRNK